MTAITLEEYIREFDARVARYIPPSSGWTPVEKAIIQPLDIFRVPLSEAEGLQLAAIQHSFQRHFTQNPTYRNYCLEHGVTPKDICTPEDLEKIPLISDRFFKEHPAGKDFATWIANLFTGKLPRITIPQSEPNFEQVIQAFNHAGLVIAYSSGTSGLQTVIPRDRHTFNLSEYAIARALLAMNYPMWDYHMSGYLLMPNPHKTNVYAGKVCEILFDAMEDVKVAIDRALPAHVVRMAMSGEKGARAGFVRLFSRLSSVNMVNRVIRWLEYHQKSGRKIALIGAPYVAWSVMKRLRKQGKRFDFGDRIGIMTGGGWKVYEGYRLPAAEFRQQAQEMLGALPKYCLDLYGMVEGNGWMVHCPEGHYLHLPYTYYRPMVVDENYKPLGYRKRGRFAFLDAAALSYPGFIVTGDMVSMLEHCPVCDRPGPVLEPEIQRASGEDLRGCGEEVRRMVAADAGG
jgi:hypothetical protein